MELENIFLAKFAEVAPDGLFTVVGGGLSKITPSAFPSSWGFLFLLARVRLAIEEAQAQHVICVERETPNGQVEVIGPDHPMARMPSTAEVGRDGRVGISFCLCLVDLVFPEAGIYKVRFKIDGQEMGMVELWVEAPNDDPSHGRA